eukprot:3691720-Ditylum_brightwellii.AAC.1
MTASKLVDNMLEEHSTKTTTDPSSNNTRDIVMEFESIGQEGDDRDLIGSMDDVDNTAEGG